MEFESASPPVVAVVVVRDPGAWLEEALGAFADQDYDNLSVLVIDAGSRVDPTARIALVIPTAYVRRLDEGRGFGVAANEVIGIVEGASHYLLCHDDVAPAPDAVRLMVEEAFRSNAGVVSPKLVDWTDPRRLLAVGAGADRVGVVHPLVDAGELDQEQHDTTRDVFVAPSGATLIRADLFAAIGGFDPEVSDCGEDLDLSWRAQVAGARVVVAPDARVRHLQAGHSGLRPAHVAPPLGSGLSDERRMRTLLTCSGFLTLLWLLPLALLYLAGEAVTALVSGHPGDAASIAASPVRALRHPARLWRARRSLQRQRGVRDRELRRLQSPGNARFRAWLRERVEGPVRSLPYDVPADIGAEEDDLWAPSAAPAWSRAGRQALPAPADEGEQPEAPARRITPRWGLPAAVVVVFAIVMIFGSRNLLFDPIPAIGSVPDTAGGVGEWWRAWLHTWQPGGLGSNGPSPPVLGLLAIAGTIFLGAAGTLQHVLVLAPLAVGPAGAYRMARAWGGKRGRIVAFVAYAAMPIGYDSLAHGDWAALVVYAGAPWVLAGLARCSDALPHPVAAPRNLAGRVVSLGLLCAFVAAVTPGFLGVLVATSVALALGSLLVGQAPVAVRTLAVGIAAAVVATVLLLPWSLRVIFHADTLYGVAPSAAAGRSFASVLRLATGPVGSGPLGWGLLVAGALPLVIGRSWRLAWAARLWSVVLLLDVWACTGSHGVVPAPTPQILGAMSAAALAGAVALGAVAFEQDLPGYRFGWRQAASGVAAAGLVVGSLAVLVGAVDGRWKLPASGAGSALTALDGAPGGDYRVLWIGAAGSLPLASSPLGGGAAWATSFDGTPDLTEEWGDGTPAGASSVVSDVHLAEVGLTTDLGHLLAPLGIRYLVVPGEGAPGGGGPGAAAALRRFGAGVAQQTDIEPLDLGPDSGYTVYLNAAWIPVRARLSPQGVAAAAGIPTARALALADLGGSPPALEGRRPDRASGQLAGGATVYVAAGDPGAWRLRTPTGMLHATAALGSGMTFSVPASGGGPAVLTVAGSGAEHAGLVVEVLLWLAAVAAIVACRRRRDGTEEADSVRPEWFAPLAPAAGAGRGATRRRKESPLEVTPEEEAWVDG